MNWREPDSVYRMAKVADNNLRIRLDDQLRDRWKLTLDARKASQQKAAVALIDWFTRQDPLVQVMVLGQVPETDQQQLSRIVLERMEAGPAKKKK